MKTIKHVLLEQIKGRECVHVFINWDGQYIDTTGVATHQNEVKWAHLTAERNRLLYIALGKILNILQKHCSNANISTNVNGLNYITLDFDGYMLRHAVVTEAEIWREKDLSGLLELSTEFYLNFIIGDSLQRYCFNKLGHLDQVVEIDDGAC